jgi:hypothetical protein
MDLLGGWFRGFAGRAYGAASVRYLVSLSRFIGDKRLETGLRRDDGAQMVDKLVVAGLKSSVGGPPLSPASRGRQRSRLILIAARGSRKGLSLLQRPFAVDLLRPPKTGLRKSRTSARPRA